MPVVDYESAWFALKAHVASKRSHGASELVEQMASLEVRHRLPEGQQGFDDRPLPPRDRSSSEPAGDAPRDLREPAQVISGAS